MNIENSSAEDNLKGQQKPSIQKSPPTKPQNTSQNFEWISCLYDLKQNQGDIEVIQNLSPSIVLNVPQNQHQQTDQNNQDLVPKTQLKIEMNKDFIFTDGLGWNWHKSWNIPDLYCNLDIRDPTTNEKLLPPSKLHAELFVCRAMINDISTFHLLDVGVKGTAKADFDGTKAVFSGLKFSSTSYNFEGSKFHLVIVIYLTQTKFEHPKILESKISPPIFVDSRKSARDTQKQKIQKISSFIDPFTVDNLEKVFVKREAKRKQTHEEVIENSYDGLCNFFSAPNIRHKVKHPIFLASRFSSCISLYYNSDLLGQEQDYEKLINKIQQSLFTICSSSNQKKPENNPENGINKPLILFLKTSPVPLRKESVNSVSKDKEEGQQQQVLTQNSKPVQEFMEPLIADCIQLVQEESEIPKGFTQISDIDLLQKSYKNMYENLKQQKESFDAKEEENNVNEEQKEENQNNNSNQENSNQINNMPLQNSLKRKRRKSKAFNSIDETGIQKQTKTGSNGNIETQPSASQNQLQTGSNSYLQEYLYQQQQQNQIQPQQFQQNQEINVFPFGPQPTPVQNPFQYFQQQQQQMQKQSKQEGITTPNKNTNSSNNSNSSKRKLSTSQKKEEKQKQKQQQFVQNQQQNEQNKNLSQQEQQKMQMQQQQQQIMLEMMKNSQNSGNMLQNWMMMYQQMQDLERQQQMKKDSQNPLQQQNMANDYMTQMFNQYIATNPAILNTMVNFFMNQYFQQQQQNQQQQEYQKILQSMMMATQTPNNGNHLEDQIVQMSQQYMIEQMQKQNQSQNQNQTPQFNQQELFAQIMQQQSQQMQNQNSQQSLNNHQQQLQQQQQQLKSQTQRKNSSIQQPKPRKKSSVDITLLVDNTNNNKSTPSNVPATTNNSNNNNNTSNNNNNVNNNKKKITTPSQSPTLGSIHKSSISSEKGNVTTAANTSENIQKPENNNNNNNINSNTVNN